MKVKIPPLDPLLGRHSVSLTGLTAAQELKGDQAVSILNSHIRHVKRRPAWRGAVPEDLRAGAASHQV